MSKKIENAEDDKIVKPKELAKTDSPLKKEKSATVHDLFSAFDPMSIYLFPENDFKNKPVNEFRPIFQFNSYTELLEFCYEKGIDFQKDYKAAYGHVLNTHYKYFIGQLKNRLRGI